MIKDSTIWKRFFAETPAFFQKVQIICFLIQLIANSLALYFPLKVEGINDVACAVIIISQFAVRDITLIQNSPDPLKAAIDLLPEIMEQKDAVIKSLKPVRDEFPETAVEQPKAA